ncbi:MAG: penicillin-insensitive murein endopeptidase [Phaeospirillum sp.]|nr:penicillin-insensitive murein endopeptidase [Phaeospirillum sp.]
MKPSHVLTLALLAGGIPAAEGKEAWAAMAIPMPGEAQVIGSAAAGCVRGAAALALDGENYQVLRPSRHRNWAHPSTVRFIRDLSALAGREGVKGVLIGDMGQSRGGPMPSGHASHQNGLDVDIWFRLAPEHLEHAEIESPRPVAMVANGHMNRATWTPAQARLVELAAQAPEVERIFINPMIKQALCRANPADHRGWLRKLRPWWGHDEHFHIRLACPTDSPGCEPQKPIPEGDGCGAELDSWLNKPTSPAPPSKPHIQSRALPEACDALLKAK